MSSPVKALSTVLCLSTLIIACTLSQAPDKNTKTVLGARGPADSIDYFVDRAAQAFFNTTPQAAGLSVGVILNDDIRSFHFGTISPGSAERPTDDTIYGIASVTKTFTGVLLAKAALDGKLRLGDDIRDYLGGSYPNLEKNGYPITVAQLVNHTSGLPNTMPDRPEMYPDYAAYNGDVTTWLNRIAVVFSDYSRDKFLADLHSAKLDTIPGTRFSYSNAGAKLAGYILEQIYGRSYEVLADSFVFRPLKMNNTGITLDAEELHQLVTGYDETGKAMPSVLDAYGAAGALKSSVVDLSRYARWHLDESDPVVKLSHTPPEGKAQDPEEGFALGLNWQMIRSGGVRRIWQDGNIPGYSSRVVIYPELNLGLVVLANQLDRSIPERIEKLADSILASMDERTFTLREGL